MAIVVFLVVLVIAVRCGCADCEFFPVMVILPDHRQSCKHNHLNPHPAGLMTPPVQSFYSLSAAIVRAPIGRPPQSASALGPACLRLRAAGTAN